jgi:hypothetical protein
MMKAVSRSAYGMSPFVRILPYIEHSDLFNTLNFQLPQSMRSIEPHNVTTAYVRVSLFACPSDFANPLSLAAAINYRANLGCGVTAFPDLREPGKGGAFALERWLSASSFPDGLSNTAFIGERLVGLRSSRNFDVRRDFGAGEFPLHNPTSADAAVDLCNRSRSVREVFSTKSGWSWVLAGYETTWYNHVNVPNSTSVDCSANLVTSFEGGGSSSGIFSSRSNHPEGTTVAFSDGAVRFMRSSISREVWRALSTRAGGEVVSDDF